MIKDSSLNDKIDYAAQVYNILNLKGHQNCMIGYKVTAIWMNGLLLPISGVLLGRVCAMQACF